MTLLSEVKRRRREADYSPLSSNEVRSDALSSLSLYRSFETTVSHIKICDFSGETFKSFEVLYFSMGVTTTQPLSSGEFCKLCYDTIPVKSASTNVSFYTNNSKMPNFEL